MRKFHALTRSLWTGLAVSAAFGTDSAPARAACQEERQHAAIPAVVKYGGARDFPPFEFLENGEPRGFQVDLIRAIGREMNVAIEIRLDDWGRIREALTSGALDLACMSDRESRREVFDFSDSFAVKGSEIFIRRGAPPIRSLADAAGRQVIVEKGSAPEDEIRSHGIQAVLVPVSTELEAIRLLASGQHDCAVTSSIGGRKAIERLGLANVVSSSPTILKSRISFAAQKGNAAMLDWVNDGLERVKLSGEFNRIYMHWLRTLGSPWTVERVLTTVAWIVAPLLGAVVVLSFVSRFLKKRVDDRTRALQLELEQRRKAEEDLAVAVDRFRVAVKTSKLIVFQQDRNLRYTWVYNGHPTIKSEAIVDKTDDEILPPEIHDFVIANKRAVIDRGASGAFEIDSMGTLGFAFHVLVEPRYDAHGKVSGLNGAAIDITELKIEEAKRLDLERRVQQSEKLETLGLLAGGIAHDFNNLLAGILGNASLASADVKPNSTAAEKLAVIERAARTASELTQQLLSFAGRGQVELGPVDVGAAAREIVDVIGGAIPKHVLLVCEEPDELPPVLGNAVQIRQVIMNLVKNGADAIGNRPGHVTVRCGIVNATRQLLADAAVGSDVPEGEYVKVEVSDDGAGMDRETLARSLEPFFTNKPGGRGIGLAVVVGAIQRHRGALFVKSTPHVGTTFQALYPVVKSDAPDAEASARPAAARGYAGTRRVLVVDDHRTVRDVICETLARAGCAVKSAGGGAEAVERFSAALKDAPFDCVVLDLTLPDGYGLDVFDSLRKLDPAAHVILTSGHDEHGAVSRIAKDPNAAFLAKPFTPSELVRVLDRLTGVAKA